LSEGLSKMRSFHLVFDPAVMFRTPARKVFRETELEELAAMEGETAEIVKMVTPSALTLVMVNPLLGASTNPVAWEVMLSGIPSWTGGIDSAEVPLLVKVMVSLRIPEPKEVIRYWWVSDICGVPLVWAIAGETNEASSNRAAAPMTILRIN
jgi:hypothetical protein